MIVKDYIKAFEKLGIGMFVHFGVYSLLGEGEWIRLSGSFFHKKYDALYEKFNPERDWAERLVATAKESGCKYIVLTTRHHDGFSLYDTCGLNDYDAPHSLAGRDLVREFVDACRAQDIIPFFYHTMLDWYIPSCREYWPDYLAYLRRSVEILCTNYGKIGGLWFDGMWSQPDSDWELDKLYGVIRSNQPEAIIINNDHRPNERHPEIDAITFEREKPDEVEYNGKEKYVANEMSQVFANHWGYAKHDFSFKSTGEIIKDLCFCRRYGANYLINVGPMGNGYLRPIEEAMLLTVGEWIKLNSEALYLPRPSGIELEGREHDFILQNGDDYYFFAYDLPNGGSPNVVLSSPELAGFRYNFKLDKKIKSVKWLDEDIDVYFEQNGSDVKLMPSKQRYGISMVVRVAKIEVEA